MFRVIGFRGFRVLWTFNSLPLNGSFTIFIWLLHMSTGKGRFWATGKAYVVRALFLESSLGFRVEGSRLKGLRLRV